MVKPMGIAGPQLGVTNTGPRAQRTFRDRTAALIPLIFLLTKREVIFPSATAWISSCGTRLALHVGDHDVQHVVDIPGDPAEFYVDNRVAASPRDRYVFATGAGPQREPFDCQSTCLWNVGATGRCHARSMGSGVRVADEAMTSDGTCDRLTTRAPAHTRPTAMLLMLTRCHRLMGQQQ